MRANPTRSYSARWRELVRDGVTRSAGALVPALVAEFAPSTVVDVGCGEGWFVREFALAGVGAVGADGPWVKDGPAGMVAVDFEKPPYPTLDRADLAVCLEVAEHVDAAYADRLVGWLVKLAPTVVFSAAIPGQGGPGHVNEQWPAYWVERFADHGYAGSGALRWRLWDDDRIEPWYRQNLLVFGADVTPDGCRPVVHPDVWGVYR